MSTENARSKNPRRTATFRKGDVTRALMAVQAAGVSIACVKFTSDGSILVSTDAGTFAAVSPDDELDRELEEFLRRHG